MRTRPLRGCVSAVARISLSTSCCPPPPPSQPLPFEKGLLPQLWAGAFADAAGEERAVAFPPLLAQNGWGHPRGAIRVGRSGGFAGSRGGRGEMRGQ